jgi:hypothetical protein
MDEEGFLQGFAHAVKRIMTRKDAIVAELGQIVKMGAVNSLLLSPPFAPTVRLFLQL